MEQVKTKKTGSFNFGARAWGIVILTLLSMFMMSSMTSDSLNITIPAFAAAGFDAAVLYSLSTAAGLVGIAGTFIISALTKKGNLRILWAVCLALGGVFAIIWANAIGYVTYFIGFAGTYMCGMGFSYVVSGAVIANWLPRKKGPAIGIATCGYPISATLTTLVLSKVVAGGVSHVYYLYAILCFVFAVIVFLLVRDYPEQIGCLPDNEEGFDREAQRREYEAGIAYMKKSSWTVKKVLTTARVWALVVAVGIGALIATGIMSNFMGKFLESGYSQMEIILRLMICGLLAIPGSILIGALDTKIGTKKTAIVVGIIEVVGVVLLLIPSPVTHIIALPFVGCMLGGSSNICVSMTVVIWGRYDFNNVYRILQPLCSAVGVVGIMLTGAIGAVSSYFTAYVVLLILAVISLLIFCLIKTDRIGGDGSEQG